jgi:hypothetical protein
MNRWVTAMLKLFKPQITELLFERDDTVAAWQKKHPRSNVYEDRELDITSEMPISLDDQITGVDAALQTVKQSVASIGSRVKKKAPRPRNVQQSLA